MNRRSCWFSLVVVIGMLLLPQLAAANGLVAGTYQLVGGQLPFTLNVMQNPDGKFFLVGNGSTADGRSCRVGDLAELRGGQLVIGACAAAISGTADGFVLNDANNCFQCVAGLSASGSYKKSP